MNTEEEEEEEEEREGEREAVCTWKATRIAAALSGADGALLTGFTHLANYGDTLDCPVRTRWQKPLGDAARTHTRPASLTLTHTQPLSLFHTDTLFTFCT